jgi:uncharacterized membrane protein
MTSETRLQDTHKGNTQSQSPRINIGATERWATGLGGGAIALYGLRQRSLSGLALGAIGAVMVNRSVRGHCSVYDKLNIDTAHKEPARPEEYYSRGIHVERSVTINKTPQELYRYWRDFSNLPRIMDHLKSVAVQDDKRSHWVAKAPAGYQVEWDAEIINDDPNKTIAWRSLAEASIANSGSVRFVPAPGDRGTEVHVTLEYIPPAGRIGVFIARLLGKEPGQQIQEDLRRFKQVMETGEVPTIEGQPAGGKRGRDRAIAGSRPLQTA